MPNESTPFINPVRFRNHSTDLMPNPQPVYRYPKADKLTRMQKQLVALDLLTEGIKPRHIRKCLGISSRQMKKAKGILLVPSAELLGIVSEEHHTYGEQTK